MKKLLFLFVAIMIVSAGAEAQPMAFQKSEKTGEKIELKKLKGNIVSEASKEQFFNDYGKIPGTQWRRSANFDEATFKKDGKVITAFYDDASSLVGTTSLSSFNQLPAKAKNIINKKYKSYSKGDVIFFDDNEANDTDMLLFGEQFDDTDSYFISLKKGVKTVVYQIFPDGDVTYFTNM